VRKAPSKFGCWIGAQTGNRGAPNVVGDRDNFFRPSEPPVSSEATRRPARSSFRLSPLSTMSGPTQYVSKKDVATSYRPKSYVSLLLDHPERLHLNPLSYPSFATYHLLASPLALKCTILRGAPANVAGFTPRTGTVQGPERDHGRDDRRVGRRGVGVLHRGRETG
jgi:hypothetical protein